MKPVADAKQQNRKDSLKLLKYLDLNQTKFKNLYEQCYDYFDQTNSTELEKIVLVNMINNK